MLQPYGTFHYCRLLGAELMSRCPRPHEVRKRKRHGASAPGRGLIAEGPGPGSSVSLVITFTILSVPCGQVGLCAWTWETAGARWQLGGLRATSVAMPRP